jgi:hypothetical protein
MKLLLMLVVTSVVMANQVETFAAESSPSVGTACNKIGKTTKIGGRLYTCIKKGNNLVWLSNAWELTRKFHVVALTPKGQPEFWSQKPTLQQFDEYGQIGSELYAPSFEIFGEWTWRDFLNDSVQQAMQFWKDSSDGKLNFLEPEIIFAPAGTAKPSASCNFKPDLDLALKYTGFKKIPIGSHLVTVNMLRKCNNVRGEAIMNGVTITLIGMYALAHEFGHNLGFVHSSTVNCANNDLSDLNNEKCMEIEYGDATDLMGQGSMTKGCKVSATTGHLHLGIPKAEDVKIGETTTIAANVSETGNKLYRFNIKKMWHFFEYRSLKDGLDAKGCYFNGESGIELRFVGAKWPSQNVYLVERFKEGEGRTQTKFGNTILTSTVGKAIFRFKDGESIYLPNSNNKYQFTALSTNSETATFIIKKVE